MGWHVDPLHGPAGRLRAAAARFGCSPSEALALALLVAAAVVGLGLLWWASRPPDERPWAGTARAPAGAEQGPAPAPAGTAPAGTAPAGTARTGAGGVEVTTVPVVVHVAGRVREPGVYRLPAGARVADALDAAGGALPDALLDHLNLARPLTDGEQVRVPGPGDLVPPRGAGSGGPGSPGAAPAGLSAWRPDGTLDLNLATADDLQELPGIGPVLSERIVAHRERLGGFTSVGQLREVDGIGERTFQRLAELVSL